MSYTITKTQMEGTHKTGSLPDTLTEADIEQVLEFAPTIPDYDRKVTRCWFFQVNGNPCGIWDYKGARWSAFDPAGVIPALFEPVLKAKMLNSLDELEKAMDAVAAFRR